MRLVIDASVALRWFVDHADSEAATSWLWKFVDDPELFVAPDVLRFEVYNGLVQFQPHSDSLWAERAFDRFDRLGIRTLPTSMEIFKRALQLSHELETTGYGALYLAQAESLGIEWLTADQKILKTLSNDPRVQAL